MRRWLRRLLLAGLLTGFLLAVPSVLVTADDGMTSPPSGIQQGNQPLPFEKYPISAYTFTIDPATWGTAAITGDPGPVASFAADFGMAILALLGMLTTSIVEWTFSADLVTVALGLIRGATDALRSTFYLQLLPVVLCALAVWAVIAGSQDRLHAVRQAIIWTVTSVILGAIFMAAPAQIVGGLDGFTSGLGRGLLLAVSGGDQRMASRVSDPAISQGDPMNAELRLAADRYHEIFVRDAYYAAEFGCTTQYGDISQGRRFGPELLAKQSGQPNNFDADFNANASQAAKDCHSGQGGLERLVWVYLGLLAAIGASLLLILNAIVVVLAKVAVVGLAVIAVVAFLVAPLPFERGGQPVGRQLFGWWFWALISALAVSVFVGLELGVVLILSDVAVKAGNWLLAVLWEGALLFVGLLLYRPIMQGFNMAMHPRQQLEGWDRYQQAQQAWQGFMGGGQSSGGAAQTAATIGTAAATGGTSAAVTAAGAAAANGARK